MRVKARDLDIGLPRNGEYLEPQFTIGIRHLRKV